MDPVVDAFIVNDVADDMVKDSVNDILKKESYSEPESSVLEPTAEPLIIKKPISDPVVSFDSLISGEDSRLTPILSDTINKTEPETRDVFIGKAVGNDSKPNGFAELDFRNMGGGDTFNEVNLEYDQC